MSSCGGILWDDASNFICASAAKILPCSMLEAELWDIFHGLKIAWSRSFRKKIQVYADSSLAIKLLKDSFPTTN